MHSLLKVKPCVLEAINMHCQQLSFVTLCSPVCLNWCRTLEQARKLDKMLSAKGIGVDAVLDFEVPESLLVS